MESSEDKNWASKYLLDPLTAPQPSEETGPGTHFRPVSTTSTSSPVVATSSSPRSTNPFRRASPSSKAPNATNVEASPTDSKRDSYPSFPNFASPPQHAFAQDAPIKGHSRGRGSSLSSRFPGDNSHHPLAQLKAENRAADHAPRLKKKHIIPPDTVDALDAVGGGYHHEGPYDPTLYARNNSIKDSPVQALADSNTEALKATPLENVLDSIHGHRPLDGVAVYPPGETDPTGHVYSYEPGENMMVEGNPEGGPYRRWEGVTYQPNDIEGKGEPTYSIENSLKERNGKGQGAQASGDIEMTVRPGNSAGCMASDVDRDNPMWGNGEEAMHRSPSGGGSSPSGLKRRFGSIKKRLSQHGNES